MLTGGQVLAELAAEAGLASRLGVGLKRFIAPLEVTAGAAVYVVFGDGGEFPLEHQIGLGALVAQGRGLVVLHSALRLGTWEARGQGPLPWQELVGMVPKRGPCGAGRAAPRTGPYLTMASGHAITSGLGAVPGYGTVPVARKGDDVNVLALLTTAKHDVPALCVRQHGEGRVCFVGVGHDRRSWEHPGWRRLVIRTITWAAGGEDRLHFGTKARGTSVL